MQLLDCQGLRREIKLADRKIKGQPNIKSSKKYIELEIFYFKITYVIGILRNCLDLIVQEFFRYSTTSMTFV